MDKQNLYLITIIIVAILIVLVAGEYFMYKYYSMIALQTEKTEQSQKQIESLPAENKTTNQTKSAEKSIISFSFDSPASAGDIDQVSRTVNIAVPSGTNIANLKPNITVSDKAIITPSSGTVQNFSKPVAYLVTAQDGSTRTYIVQLIMQKSSERAITSFKLKTFYPVIEGDINEKNHTVYAVVPDGTDLTNIIPTILVSNNATIFPASGTKVNFNVPIIYTVKAQDGSTQDYTIMVVTESNSG